MGNQNTRPLSQSEALADLASIVFKDTLGGGRFFKSSLCVHDDGGLVVVKTFIRRPDSPDVRPYVKALNQVSQALAAVQDAPHVWAGQQAFASERAVHLIRQYLYATVAERIARRPFLTHAEKCWLAYQILLGLCQSHGAGVCHGDIKLENVLVTSWGWAFLADFAPFKPTLLPADNPAEFSFFFDTGGRRKCTLAPERFYDSATHTISDRAAVKLTPAMDIFSAGCVIAELFADGATLFDYSKLLEYRRGTYDVVPALSSLDPAVKSIVLHMIQLHSENRLPAAEYANQWATNVLSQHVVESMHPMMADLLLLEPEVRAARVANEYKSLLMGQRLVSAENPSTSANAETPHGSGDNNPEVQKQKRGTNVVDISAREQAVSLLAEAQTILKRLAAGEKPVIPEASPSNSHTLAKTVQEEAKKANLDVSTQSLDSSPQCSRETLTLLASLLCSVLHGCRKQDVRIQLLRQLSECAATCDDEVRLQRALPHLVASAAEQPTAVRCAALRLLPRILDAVQSLPPGEARVIGEYVFPSLSRLPTEIDPAVQAEYAAAVALLASRGHALLEGLQRQAAASSADGSRAPINYDEEARRLRAGVEHAVHDLLVGSRAEPKLGLLPHLGALTLVLGRRDTVDVLLPALLTLFNSREWEVRAAMYQYLPGVCRSLGTEGVAFALLPFLDKLISDPENAAVAEALGLLATLCSSGLLRKRTMLIAAGKVCDAGLLQSTSTAVRAAAVAFIVAVSSQLSTVDSHALLLPSLASCLESLPSKLQDKKQLLHLLPKVNVRGLPSNPSAKEIGQSSSVPAVGDVGAASTSAIPPNLPSASYSMMVDMKHARPGASVLSTALSQSVHLGGTQLGVIGESSGTVLTARAQRNVQLPSGIADSVRSQLVGPSTASGLFGKGAVGSVRSAGMGIRSSSATDAAKKPDNGVVVAPWRPRGVLTANLTEHKRSILCLAADSSAPFFVSASADGTAKVWDCRRLEKDLSFRSRITYQGHQGSAVTSACLLRDGHSVVTGAVDGQLHLWRVEYNAATGSSGEKYTSIIDGNGYDPGSEAVLSIAAWNNDVVVASTQKNGILAWDLRTGQQAWNLNYQPGDGLLERFVCDPEGCNWLVTGSSRGYFCLWDLRFMLPVHKWRHPAGTPITAMALTTATTACLSLSDPPPAGPLIYAASSEREVALWDIAQGTCRGVFRTLLPPQQPEEETSSRVQLPAALTPVSAISSTGTGSGIGRQATDVVGRARHLSLSEIQAPKLKRDGFLALLPTSGGQLLTGGTDCTVRCWESSQPQQSYVVAAPPPSPIKGLSDSGEGPRIAPVDVPKYSYVTRTMHGVAVIEESCKLERHTLSSDGTGSGRDYQEHLAKLQWAERAAGLAHKQAVTDIVRVQGLTGPLLVTCSTDGVVKAWK